MLFKEIIAVYMENHSKYITQNPTPMIVKADGTYIYRSALKSWTQY
jgi:hypothetical protein